MPNRKGSVLLETGLALPVFGLLLVGGLDFGRMTIAKQSVVSAARAGAQAVVVAPKSFRELNVRDAVERDSPSLTKRTHLERFEQDGRRYLRVTVETDATGMLGIPNRTLRAQAVVRLP